jgi:hypothetical protein
MSFNDTTGPIVVPADGHYPAGWASPESAEAANRAAIALELAQEREAADRADQEAAIDARIAERRDTAATVEGQDTDQEAAIGGL